MNNTYTYKHIPVIIKLQSKNENMYANKSPVINIKFKTKIRKTI